MDYWAPFASRCHGCTTGFSSCRKIQMINTPNEKPSHQNPPPISTFTSPTASIRPPHPNLLIRASITEVPQAPISITYLKQNIPTSHPNPHKLSTTTLESMDFRLSRSSHSLNAGLVGVVFHFTKGSLLGAASLDSALPLATLA